MSNNEEWEEDADIFVGECDHCGKTRPVKTSGDPFIAEIYPENDNSVSAWCRQCWQDRVNET